MMKPSALPTVKACEDALDAALKDLRQLDGSTNVLARGSIEYRVGAIRKRRDVLQRLR